MNRFSTIAERVATRPIRIDRSVAQESIARLVADLKRGYWARNPETPLGDSYTLVDNITIEAVDGSELDVQVQYRSRASNSSEMILGGGSGKTSQGKKPAIIVMLNGRMSANVFLTIFGETFVSKSVFILMHEMSHIADIYRDTSGTKSQSVPTESELDLKAYYNNPSEVRAYMREVAEEIISGMQKLYPSLKLNTIMTKLPLFSPTWKHISRHLTSESKSLILKGVYQAVQDYISEQGSQKAASDILKVSKSLI